MSIWTGTLHYSLQGSSSRARGRLDGKIAKTFVVAAKTGRRDVGQQQADTDIVDELIEFLKQLKAEQQAVATSTARPPVELDHLTLILMKQ